MPLLLPSQIFIVEVVINGLILAFIYALMGIGLTLIYSILRVVNFAHGELYMLGGYSLYYFTMTLGVSSFLGLPIAAGVGFLTALTVERLIIRDTYVKAVTRPVEYALLGTLAVSVLLQNFAISVFGPFLRSPKPFVLGEAKIIGFTITWDRFVILLASAILVAMLMVFLNRTWTGRIWMAVSQNRFAAQALGIDVERVGMLSFGLSGALAAVAGGLLAPIIPVYPTSGLTPLVVGFVIIVIGGLGSIKGSLIGSIIVAIVQSTVTALVSPAYGEIALWLLLIAFLMFRPSGLFGERVRAV